MGVGENKMGVPKRTQELHDAHDLSGIRQKGTGWQVRMRLPNGRRLEQLEPSKERALAFRDALREQLRSGRWVPAESVKEKAPPTLKTWAAEWLDRREISGAHRAIATERGLWKLHIDTAAFAGKSLPEITRVDVIEWLDELERRTSKIDPTKKLSWSRRRQALVLLSCALTDAIDRGIITTNVTTGIRVSKPAVSEEPWTFLTLDEIELVKRAKIDTAVKRVFLAAIYTGLRQGELWALTWGDVKLEGTHPVIVVTKSHDGPTKSGRARRVHLIAPAIEVLGQVKRDAEQSADEDLVFPAKRGGQRHPHDDAGWGSGTEGRTRLLRVECGITRRVRFHDLRHTFASHLAMGSWGERWSLQEIAQALGHSSVTVTERYAHLADESLAARAARTVGAPAKVTPKVAVDPTAKAAESSKNDRKRPQKPSKTPSSPAPLGSTPSGWGPTTPIPRGTAPKPKAKTHPGETTNPASSSRDSFSRGDWIRTSDPQTPSAEENEVVSDTSDAWTPSVPQEDLFSGALAVLQDVAAKLDYGASLASLVADLLALDPTDEEALSALLVDETQPRRAVALASKTIRRVRSLG